MLSRKCISSRKLRNNLSNYFDADTRVQGSDSLKTNQFAFYSTKSLAGPESDLATKMNKYKYYLNLMNGTYINIKIHLK